MEKSMEGPQKIISRKDDPMTYLFHFEVFIWRIQKD